MPIKSRAQKGYSALFILIAVLLLLGVGLVFTSLWSKKYTLPFSSQTKETTNESTVTLKTDYQNPFDKNTQYVNPFSEYKNPFDSLK